MNINNVFCLTVETTVIEIDESMDVFMTDLFDELVYWWKDE